MNRAKTLGMLLFRALLFSAIQVSSHANAQSAPQNSSRANSPQKILAYYESAGSYDSLTTFSSSIDQLSTDTLGVDMEGKIKGNAPEKALAFAKSKGMPSFACVSNFGAHDFDPKIAHAVLANTKIKQRVIAGLLKRVQDAGYSGVNIDFESINHEERKQFSAFVREVARKMHAAGLLTVVSVPAKRQDDPNDAWTGAFDFATLGRDADILQVMTYDQHGPWGAPGAVAGLNWVEPSIQYALSVVPASKVSLGIPAYGYDWNLTKKTGEQIHWKDIPALIANTGAAAQWDAASSSPFFNYQAADGSSHVVWYEDAKSIPLKSALAVSYKLAGVSVFALGFEDAEFWRALHAGGF
jgi:spore germination protein